MFQAQNPRSRDGLSWWRNLERITAAIALAAAPLLALEAPTLAERSLSTSSDTSSVAGDETIGTLPIFAPPAFDLLRFLLDPQASVYLQGNRLDLMSSIVRVEGRTAATLEVLDAETDTVRVVFHGRPHLVLDREMVNSGAVVVGVEVPAAGGARQLRAFQGARTSSPERLSVGGHELAVAGLGVDSASSPRRGVVLDGPGGLHTVLAIRATRQYVILDQAH